MRFVSRFGLAEFAALGLSISLGLFADGILMGGDLLRSPTVVQKETESAPVRTRRNPKGGLRGKPFEVGYAESGNDRISKKPYGVPLGPNPKLRWRDCGNVSTVKDRTIGRTRPLKLFSKPRPEYTDVARELGVQGTVILRVTFGANDKILMVSVVKGLPHGLSDRAIEAAWKMRFKAPLRNGQPYTVNKVVHFNFRIC